MSDLILVYTTIDSLKKAEDISQGLLESGLCACINLLPQMTSFYKWQGHLEKSQESVLLIKTSQSNYKQVESYIKKKHPYDCPAIFFLKIDQMEDDYKKWFLGNLKD